MTIREFFKKLGSPILWGNFLAMAVLGIGLVFGTLYALDRYTYHGKKIVVPELRGRSQAEAELVLQRLGLVAAVSDSGFVRTLPVGAVLGQSLKAGTEVKPGRTVYLTLNSGNQPTIALPDIADNSSYREAESRLLAIGFKLGPTEYIDGEKDWVYSVKAGGRIVSAGTRVSVDTPVVLVVGNGNTDEDIYVEDSTDYSDDFFFDEGGVGNEGGAATEEEYPHAHEGESLTSPQDYAPYAE